MTIVCVKGRQMAVDSMCYQDGVAAGEVVKWRAVQGDGYVAAAGDLTTTQYGLDRVAEHQLPENCGGDDSYLWLKADGSVWALDTPCTKWVQVHGAHHAVGVAAKFSRGAMAAGETAAEAARLATENHAFCGGEIVVLDLPDVGGQ